jgi:hypothetical protein
MEKSALLRLEKKPRAAFGGTRPVSPAPAAA